MTVSIASRPGRLAYALTLLAFGAMVSATTVWAQIGDCPPGSNLEIEVSAPEFETIFLSNFNIVSQFGSASIFTVTIRNLSPGPMSVRMNFEMVADAYASEGPIIEATTDPFDVTGTRQVTSSEVVNGTTGIHGDVNYNTDIAQSLQDAILSTGRLPSGRYRLNLVVENVDNPTSDRCVVEKIYDISNPTTLDLVAPGGKGECPTMFTKLPLFQWESNASKFIIRVCEKRPENASPEDVMNNESMISEEPLVAGTDFVSRPSFQYPPSGAFPLVEGRTYYWQVTALIESPSGEVPLQSDIWCFRVADLTGGAGSAEQLQIMNYLRALLGDEAVDQMFGDGGSLFGYTATGTILKDGSSITVLDFGNLVGEVQSGEKAVGTVTVE